MTLASWTNLLQFRHEEKLSSAENSDWKQSASIFSSDVVDRKVARIREIAHSRCTDRLPRALHWASLMYIGSVRAIQQPHWDHSISSSLYEQTITVYVAHHTSKNIIKCCYFFERRVSCFKNNSLHSNPNWSSCPETCNDRYRTVGLNSLRDIRDLLPPLQGVPPTVILGYGG